MHLSDEVLHGRPEAPELACAMAHIWPPDQVPPQRVYTTQCQLLQRCRCTVSQAESAELLLLRPHTIKTNLVLNIFNHDTTNG